MPTRRYCLASIAAGLILAEGCATMHRTAAVQPLPSADTCVTLRSLMRESLDPCIKQLQPIIKHESMTDDDYLAMTRLANALEEGAYRIADYHPKDATKPLEEYYWHGGVLVSRANDLRWACVRQNGEGVRLALSAVLQSCNACHEKFRVEKDVAGLY